MAAAAKRSDLPAIPPTAGALRPILEAMREVIVTGEGHRGDALDRKITVRDLLGTGLVDIRRGSRPGVGGLVPTNPAPDMSIPPGPGGFQAVSVFGFITLIWDSPAKHYRNHGLTNIYRSSEDNIANAVMVGRTAGFSYNDPMRGDLAGTEGFYYWIRWVSSAGVEGPPNSPDGTYVEPTPDLDWLMDKISGEISESWLDQELKERIDLIDGEGAGSVNDRIKTARDDLEEQIRGISDALAYDPASTYAAGDSVRGGPNGRRLYQALQAVPANNPPPNAQYWLDIGQVVEEAGAVVQQVQKNTADIGAIGGQVTAQASRVEVLRAALRDNDGAGDLNDALRGWQSTAQFAEQVKIQATEYEATTTRLTTLDSQVAGNRSSITLLEETVATEKIATAQQIAVLKSGVEGNAAQTKTLSETMASQNEAMGRRVDTVSVSAQSAQQTADASGQAAAGAQSTANAANAAIQNEQTARINGDLAQAQATMQLQVKVDGNSASLQQQATVLNGVSAAYVIKTDVNGYVSGYGLYNNGQTSDFAVNVDRFWIGTPNSSVKPFMLVGGISYLDTAMIRDASIQSGKLGPISFGKLVDASGNPITTVAGKLMAQHIAVDQIEIGFAQVSGDVFSTNYIPGLLGWRLARNGDFEINGSVPGGPRLKITPSLIQMWYPNGDVMMRMGTW